MKMFTPHPGSAIPDAMEELNVGIEEMAKALDIAPSSLQRLVTEQTSILPKMAVLLSEVIGNSPEVSMRLQDAYNLYKAEQTVNISPTTQLYPYCGSEATSALKML